MAALERLEWKDIDSAPREGILIVAWGPGDLPYVTAWVGDGWLRHLDQGRHDKPEPTKWLVVLPKPPMVDAPSPSPTSSPHIDKQE